MIVVIAGALSVLLYLPLLALVQFVPPRKPAVRAAVWLVGLHAPLIGGVLFSIASLHIAAVPGASPHAERLRPHICFLGLASGPDGPFRAKIIAAFAAALLVAGLVRFLAGAVTSERLRRFAAGLAHDPDGPHPGTVVIPSTILESYSVGLWRGVVVTALPEGRRVPEDQHAAVIAHERCHVHRRDNLVDLCNAAAVTVLAFLPPPHLYRTYWRQESEFECDDAAAQATSSETVLGALKVFGMEAGEGAARLLEKRVARLADRELEVQPSASLAPMFWATVAGLLMFIVAAWLLRRPELDTLHCMATSFLQALHG